MTAWYGVCVVFSSISSEASECDVIDFGGALDVDYLYLAEAPCVA